MTEPREGQTVQSILPLKTGSNAVMAVASKSDAPTERKLALLAETLGEGIGAVPEHAGTYLSYDYWTIGDARPAVLRLQPTTAEWMQWYERLGSPVGPYPEFFSVNVDWRGPPMTFEWPAGVFVVPAASKTVHSPDANFADMSRDETAEYLQHAEDARITVERWGDVDETAVALGEAMDRSATSMRKGLEKHMGWLIEPLKWILGGLGIVAGGVLIYVVAKRARG